MTKQLTLSQFNNLRLSNFAWFQLIAGQGSSEPKDRKPSFTGETRADFNDMLADMAKLKREVESKERAPLEYYVLILHHKLRGSYEYHLIFDRSALN